MFKYKLYFYPVSPFQPNFATTNHITNENLRTPCEFQFRVVCRFGSQDVLSDDAFPPTA